MARAVVEAAVGNDGEALGRSVPECEADRGGDLLGRLDKVRLDVDDADSDPLARPELLEKLDLLELAVCELKVELVGVRVEQDRKQLRVVAPVARAALEVSEAEVQPDARVDAAPRFVEQRDELYGSLLACHVTRLHPLDGV